MVCESPIRNGSRKGESATGTNAGRARHFRAGEPSCDACLEAAYEYNRQWGAAHPEKRKANMRRARAKRYRDHKADALAASRRWAVANPDKRRAIERRWDAVNGKARNARRQATLAKVATIPFTRVQLDQRFSMFGHRCYLRLRCDGIEAHGVDHVIPISRGGPHCLSNLRPACQPCNAAKGAKTLEQLGIIS